MCVILSTMKCVYSPYLASTHSKSAPATGVIVTNQKGGRCAKGRRDEGGGQTVIRRRGGGRGAQRAVQQGQELDEWLVIESPTHPLSDKAT